MFWERRDHLFDDLERRRPEVIALQEVTPELLSSLLDEPWVQASYQVSDVELSHYDVVILSRLPVRRAFRLALPSGMGRRLVIFELACGLAVATVHLESMREEAQARAAQLQIIQPVLQEYFEDVVLVGDMNFEPGAKLENAALDPAFVDAWSSLHPKDPGFTVDTNINSMRLQIKGTPSRKRIDRAFIRGPHWKPRSIELIGTKPIHADGTFISDHFGLEVTLGM
jgi:endonuclease/exonuclease/phosphatase family metal-dependent hydrolase